MMFEKFNSLPHHSTISLLEHPQRSYIAETTVDTVRTEIQQVVSVPYLVLASYSRQAQ